MNGPQRDWVHKLEAGYGVTLIAAAALHNSSKNRARAIIMVSDRMLSGPGASQHTRYSKITPVGKTWLIGYAGSPGHYLPIRNALGDGVKPEMTSDEVVTLLIESFQEYRQTQIERQILSPLGLTRESFWKSGRGTLGDEAFQEVVHEIRSFDLDIDFLLAGWSPKTPWDVKLTTVCHPGASYNHTISAVAAIGSGAPIALGHLYSFFDTFGTMQYAQYRMLEAKFMSEAERSVGPSTVLITMDDHGTTVLSDPASFSGRYGLLISKTYPRQHLNV